MQGIDVQGGLEWTAERAAKSDVLVGVHDKLSYLQCEDTLDGEACGRLFDDKFHGILSDVLLICRWGDRPGDVDLFTQRRQCSARRVHIEPIRVDLRLDRLERHTPVNRIICQALYGQYVRRWVERSADDAGRDHIVDGGDHKRRVNVQDYGSYKLRSSALVDDCNLSGVRTRC